MAYTTPTTASGQVLTSATWNASVRDNGIFFYTFGANRGRAEVTHNTTQSIANNSATALTFNTENHDEFGTHSGGAATRLTVPTDYDGWWLVGASFAFAANGTGLRQAIILVNGATQAAVQTVTAASGADHAFTIMTVIPLSATNYVEVQAFQTSGGALNVQAGATFRALWLAEL